MHSYLCNVLPMPEAPTATAELTPRETELLQTIADGATVRTAATALGIEVGTAYNHLQSIGKKLGTRSTTHSLVAALRSELITLHPQEVKS